MTPHLAWNSFTSVLVRFANSRHPLCRSRRKSHRNRGGRAICRNGSLIGRHAPLLAFMLRPSGSNLGGNVCLLGSENEKTWLLLVQSQLLHWSEEPIPASSRQEGPVDRRSF